MQHQIKCFEVCLFCSPLTVMTFESCNTVLPQATWTVTLFFPSLWNMWEMLPSKVIMGWISKVGKKNKQRNAQKKKTYWINTTYMQPLTRWIMRVTSVNTINVINKYDNTSGLELSQRCVRLYQFCMVCAKALQNLHFLKIQKQRYKNMRGVGEWRQWQ